MSDVSKETIEKEIEAKKRKILELQRRRQERNAAPASTASVTTTATSTPAVAAPTPLASASSVDDILNSVNSLLSTTAGGASLAAPIASSPSSSSASANDNALTHSSTTSSSQHVLPLSTRLSRLSVSTTIHTDIAPVERIQYEQGSQTERIIQTVRLAESNQTGREVRSSNHNKQAEVKKLSPGEPGYLLQIPNTHLDQLNSEEKDNFWEEDEEIRQERDYLRSRELELLNNINDLKKQLVATQEARMGVRKSKKDASHTSTNTDALHDGEDRFILSGTEREKLENSEEFQSFFSRTSKIIERLMGYEERQILRNHQRDAERARRRAAAAAAAGPNSAQTRKTQLTTMSETEASESGLTTADEKEEEDINHKHDNNTNSTANAAASTTSGSLSDSRAFDYLTDYGADEDDEDSLNKNRFSNNLLTLNQAFFFDGITKVDNSSNNATSTNNPITSSNAATSNLTSSNASPFANLSLKNRAVTCIDFSPKYSELLLASYAQPFSGHSSTTSGIIEDSEINSLNQPDGTVLVWNLHMATRPEYIFSCASSLNIAQFHPQQPKLIYAGGDNGQIVVFDMRANKNTPVNRTSLSHGHTSPIFDLKIVQRNNGLFEIVTLSNDGQVCVWNENNLHTPVLDVMLKNKPGQTGVASTNKGRVDIASTCFDYSSRDLSQLLVGSDEGYIYKSYLYDSHLLQQTREEERKTIFDSCLAHDAPITNISFHPSFKAATSSASTLSSDLFLSSSYDWTVKLFSSKYFSAPLYTFESASDYVTDVCWCPTSPFLFAQSDATGKLDIWNLEKNVEVPSISMKVGQEKTLDPTNTNDNNVTGSNDSTTGGSESSTGSSDGSASTRHSACAISRLRWSKDGNMLGVGLSTGELFIYDISAELAQPTREDIQRFNDKISYRIKHPQE